MEALERGEAMPAYHSKPGKFNIGHMSEDGLAFQQIF